jgi:hypothetical protein
MALLLALLKPQPAPATPTDPPADIDQTDYLAQYNLWIGTQPPPNPPLRPERRELALAGLYDVLHYSHSPSAELGLVLATLVSYQPIANPASNGDIRSLRRDLRQGMIMEFQRLRGAFP